MGNESGSDLFFDQLRQALNNFSDPAWLGTHSSLAAPYFLGQAAIKAEATTAVSRGQVLQQALLEAAHTLWAGALPRDAEALLKTVNEVRREQGNKGRTYYFLLLELRYFRQYYRSGRFPRENKEPEIRELLGVGRGPFFTHLKNAREALGQALLRLLHPTLRIEPPPYVPTQLIGREAERAQLHDQLQAHSMVAISGMGGTGKTTLAAAVVHQWDTSPVFWFTLRPTFNDTLDSLLFSLGYFLNQHGMASLWLQLVANQGKMSNPNLALALIRGDLTAVSHPPLLCFDEVDNLSALNPDRLTLAQLQLRELINGLRTLFPILLVGQHHELRADHYLTLTGLTEGQIGRFLKNQSVNPTATEIEQLHAYTAGNPRLLHLCLSIHEKGKPITALLKDLPQTLAMQALFTYLWRKLSSEERLLMQQLAVFRSPAPADAFAISASTIQQLTGHQIIQHDRAGGISLLPILHDYLNNEPRWLSSEQKEQLHLEAALVRATRAEYTAAAYHYGQAGENEAAVSVWFPHRQQEIERGQATAALAIFARLSTRQLSSEAKTAVSLIRAELYQLQGNFEKGLAELDAMPAEPKGESTLQANWLRANLLSELGYPDRALQQLDDGINLIARLHNQLASFHHLRSNILMKDRQLDEGWRAAKLAQFSADYVQALIHEEQGQYGEAHLTYQRSLALAETIEHTSGIAQTQRALSRLFGRQQKMEKAVQHAEEALTYYRAIGDRFNMEQVRSIQAAMYLQMQDFAAVIKVGEPALRFFERAKMSYWAATTAVNLAEAYYESGQPDLAEETAHKVLQAEEPYTIPYAYFTLGLVQQGRNDLQTALTIFQQSQQFAEQNGDSFMAAYAWRAQGTIQTKIGQQAEAKAAFEEALRRFKTLQISGEVAQTQALLDALAS